MTTRNVEIKVAWLQNPDTSALPELATLAHSLNACTVTAYLETRLAPPKPDRKPWHRVVQT